MIIILRQVYIYKDDELLYYRHFGKALKREIFDNLIEELRRDAFAGGLTKVQYHDYYKYRISYTTEPELGLIFVFVTGLTDNFENIKKELIRCKKEFLNLFEDILHHRFDAKTFEIFDPTVDSIHRNLRPKISLVGFSGVGKTTITRLIKAEEIPMQHIPTITGDIATIKIGKLHFHLWDFAGQEQFSYLWNNFIKGSDAVLLITDSTLENVEKSKFFLELIKERAPHAHTAVIGNKQDLEGAMKPEQIEKILGLKTYSMVAKDPSNRDKMIQIIADVLEMSAEVSPLLKPLLERDKLTEEATKAIEDGDFEKAALLFEKISDLCIELGDDSLGREFYEKAQKIKNMLKKIGVESAETTQTPISEQEAPPPAPKQAPKVAAPKQPAPPPAPKQPAPPPAPKQAPKVAAPKQPAPPPAPKQPAPPPAPKQAPKVAAPKQPAPPPAPKQPAPPPAPKQAPEVAAPKQPPLKKEGKPKFQGIPGMPNLSIPLKKVQSEVAKKLEEEDSVLIKPKIQQPTLKLKIDPSAFMVKQRPKTVSVVPKDAKDKLKISPFAQVTNPSQPYAPSTPQQTPKIQKPPEPPKIIEQQPTVHKETVQKPLVEVTPPLTSDAIQKPLSAPSISKEEHKTAPSVSPETELPPKVIAAQQKQNIEQTLIDLKIKKANIQKMALDFDMQELSGEISAEELAEKKKRLEILEKKIDEQIANLEKLL
ncbi:MAG: ADP-ribosylation factor-like protein [Promethearchaeota archaeon]